MRKIRLSLFYNPLVMIDRLAVEINRRKRKTRLKGTPAACLSLGHIDSLELLELIKGEANEIKTIYDVGANVGTWTLLAKSIFRDAGVHAFEPLAMHVDKFNKNTSRLSNIIMHPFCLGNEDTTAPINISSFSDSSSLLNPTTLEYEHFGIKKTGEENVPVKRLGALLDQGALAIADLIKLDVQGFELEVLKGAGEYLHQVSYIIAEVSFREYYQGQPLFMDIANYLAAFNFHIHAFGHATPTGQELGQIDILFKKER